jgi:hypothetical protein
MQKGFSEDVFKTVFEERSDELFGEWIRSKKNIVTFFSRIDLGDVQKLDLFFLNNSCSH